MVISKKKIKDIREGDILIMDFLDPNLRDHILIRSVKHKDVFEGESQIFLFEVDDIDHEFKDRKNKTGSVYTFYHMDEMFDNTRSFTLFFNNKEKEVDVIHNPHHTLKHYKN